ncbi:MAG: ATP-binding protein, partial [Eggerthellaceae bacterium]|nr:ATP-binding protein [Eggerthellaceae bacterium]
DLARFIETVNPETHLRVERELGDGFVVLRRDEAERRQAIQDVRCSEDIVVELLRNSRDAGASAIYVATILEGDTRTLVVVDNGCGVPASMHEMIFEPRVTSKLDTMHMDRWGIHGRGMALFSIRENCLEAKVCASAPNRGAAILTRSNIHDLPEKADQSSFPRFTLEESGQVKISGPKNILRTCAEFALEHRGQVSVFVGSYSEIAAALLASALGRYSMAELSLKPDCQTVPYPDRPAFTRTPVEFAHACEELGITLSSRTARRILDGEIAAAEPLHDVIRHSITRESSTPDPQPGTSKRLRRRRMNLRLAREDTAEFARDVAVAYRNLAEKYYLDPESAPTVRQKGSNLTVSIPLRSSEE